jgi:hypothetical protein
MGRPIVTNAFPSRRSLLLAAQAPALTQARPWDIPSWSTDYAGAKAASPGRMDALVAELRDGGRDWAGARR